MNLVALIGRTTKDVDIRYNNDLAIARVTLAVDRKGKDQPTDFINCVSFGKTAETLSKYVGKGQKVGITGRIQTGSYKKQDGSTVYTTDIVVDGIDFLEKKGATLGKPQQASFNAASNEGFMKVDNLQDEGLPFN